MFKQGSEPKGIFGFGEIVEAARLREDDTDTERGVAYRAGIRFDKPVDPGREFLLDYDSIRNILPDELVTSQASGVGVPGSVETELERRLSSFLVAAPQLENDQADDPSFDPDSVQDDRERAFRAIRLRRSQPAFRSALIEAYCGRCAITRCSVHAVLEAAHIYPYRGTMTNHVSNGLLLRADIHTLFDCQLIAVDPNSRRVVVAAALTASSYNALAGKQLLLPNNASDGPSKRNLERRYREFQTIYHV